MDIFSFFSSDFWQTHALCLMFVSAFLSATVLPGNSEVVFVALAVPKLVLGSLFSTDILALVFFATLGNGLGSLTTYGIGRWMPKFDPKNHRTLWAMNQIKRYGVDCFTFKLVTCRWRFILCHSGLVKIKFCSK